MRSVEKVTVGNQANGQCPVISVQFSSCLTDHLATDHPPPTTSFTNSPLPLKMVLAN
jgi:hypothetical protein